MLLTCLFYASSHTSYTDCKFFNEWSKPFLTPSETLVIASLFTAGPVFPLWFHEKFLTNILSIDGLLDPQQHSCVPLVKPRD